MMMNYRLVRDNPASLPLHLCTDGVVDLRAVPSVGDELMLKPAHYVVLRVMHRVDSGPLLIVDERPLPEYRGQPYRAPPPASDV